MGTSYIYVVSYVKHEPGMNLPIHGGSGGELVCVLLQRVGSWRKGKRRLKRNIFKKSYNHFSIQKCKKSKMADEKPIERWIKIVQWNEFFFTEVVKNGNVSMGTMAGTASPPGVMAFKASAGRVPRWYSCLSTGFANTTSNVDPSRLWPAQKDEIILLCLRNIVKIVKGKSVMYIL